MQALYQLSYAPDGGLTLPVDSPGSSERGHYAPARDRARRRHPEAPLQRRHSPTRSSTRGRTVGTPSTCSGRPTAPGCWPRIRATWPIGPSRFVLDMFPYPSGAGLHVGHPLGFIATDVYARFSRMTGLQRAARDGLRRVRSPRRAVRGADRHAPARHHRGEHRQHEAPDARARSRSRPAPRPGHHRRRLLPVDAVDLPADLQLLVRRRRRPRPADRGAGRRVPCGHAVDARRSRRSTRSRSQEQRELVDSYRLAYIAEAPVNWCPGLGTVLANEEVTADGRSERGNFPVYKRPLKQWMMRITAYADRLLADLDQLDWSESIKLMQRNWIGRSTGALGSLPGRRARRPRDRGVHDPARHAVRRHLHGARARAPARRRASPPTSGRATTS